MLSHRIFISNRSYIMYGVMGLPIAWVGQKVDHAKEALISKEDNQIYQEIDSPRSLIVSGKYFISRLGWVVPY